MFVKCLLRWNPKTQRSEGEGILGDVIAFAPAHEEQGRHTLHTHCQVWVKQLNSEVRRDLFQADPIKQTKARQAFYDYVDTIMRSSYSTPLSFDHVCVPINGGESNLTEHLHERELQTFRDARHQELWKDIPEGCIIQCRACHTRMSPVHAVTKTFCQRMESYGISDTTRPPQQLLENAHLRDASITNAQLDAAAYCYSYDVLANCDEAPVHYENTVWNDSEMRELLLQHRFEHHAMCHCMSCFKKGNECRFLFPFKCCASTRIYPDEIDKTPTTPWHCLSDPDIMWMSPWILTPKRDLGSEYMNTFNHALSGVFNCNTNVQVGDIWQIFYSTLYGSKSTQKEDSERVQRILQCVARRLLKIEERKLLQNDKSNDKDETFSQSLGIMLSGLQAATSRHCISATMAHLIVSLGGTRFQFSHEFGTLLVSQLEATLKGEEADVYIKRTEIKGDTLLWHDSTSEDYIYRPDSLQHICAYYMAMHYQKVMKPRKVLQEVLSNFNTSFFHKTSASDTHRIDNTASDASPHDGDETTTIALEFNTNHPNAPITQLVKRKKWVVPITYYDGAALCGLANLNIDSASSTSKSSIIIDEYREDYARIALLMFYPYRKLEDIMINGSYWAVFKRELDLYRQEKETTMWRKGFSILQNIENRKMLQSHRNNLADEITDKTTNRCIGQGSRSKAKSNKTPKKVFEE